MALAGMAGVMVFCGAGRVMLLLADGEGWDWPGQPTHKIAAQKIDDARSDLAAFLMYRILSVSFFAGAQIASRGSREASTREVSPLWQLAGGLTNRIQCERGAWAMVSAQARKKPRVKPWAKYGVVGCCDGIVVGWTDAVSLDMGGIGLTIAGYA